MRFSILHSNFVFISSVFYAATSQFTRKGTGFFFPLRNILPLTFSFEVDYCDWLTKGHLGEMLPSHAT